MDALVVNVRRNCASGFSFKYYSRMLNLDILKPPEVCVLCDG